MKLDATMRIVLALLLLVFGANRLLHFIPEPPWPVGASAFLQALEQTGYMTPFIAVVDVVTGTLLLINRYVPLALAATLPVLANAFLFHVFLAPGTMLFAVLSLALDVALIVRNRRSFQDLLAPNASQAAPPRVPESVATR